MLKFESLNCRGLQPVPNDEVFKIYEGTHLAITKINPSNFLNVSMFWGSETVNRWLTGCQVKMIVIWFYLFVVFFSLFKEHFMILKERKIQSKTWLSWNHFNLQGRYMIWTDAAFFFFGDFTRAQGGPCIIWLICFHIQRWSSYPMSLRCLVVLISFSTIKLLVVGC